MPCTSTWQSWPFAPLWQSTRILHESNKKSLRVRQPPWFSNETAQQSRLLATFTTYDIPGIEEWYRGPHACRHSSYWTVPAWCMSCRLPFVHKRKWSMVQIEVPTVLLVMLVSLLNPVWKAGWLLQQMWCPVLSYSIVPFDALFHNSLAYITASSNNNNKIYISPSEPTVDLLLNLNIDNALRTKLLFSYRKTCSWEVSSPPTQSYVKVSLLVPAPITTWLVL